MVEIIPDINKENNEREFETLPVRGFWIWVYLTYCNGSTCKKVLKKQDAEGNSASWGLWFFGINGDDVGGVDGFIGFLVQHKQPQGYGADLVNAFQAEAAQIPQFDVA